MRKLILDICDYNRTAVCNLYDNQANIVGQATDVFIKTECRTGWKELSFTLPSYYDTEEGRVKNYRLDYLKADWWIRAIDDYTVDWYIISQPKITHNAFSQNVEVVAGHISQILKTKNLGLEFSDNEGNNVGTAKQLLDCILENTGWVSGEVAQFMEDDDFSKEKKRSLDSPTRSGAFKHITTMCELFDAYPVFHGDEKTVDILPINPFSREIEFDDGNMKVGKAIDLEEGQIPVVALHTEVLELHYDKNVKNISRTINTENIVTKLTAEGNIGDTTVEPCSLSNATHYEYTFTTEGISKGTEVCFEDMFGVKHYFTAIENIPAGELNYSTLDFLSQSYIWDGTIAHPVYKTPKGSYTTFPTVEAEAKKNWFTYLINLGYYQDIGLLTQEMLNSAAEFQHATPELLEASYNASLAMSDQLSVLSQTGNSMTGFLKLAISGSTRVDGNSLKLNIDKTQGDENDKGVLYRSDYAETRRKRFPWHVAHKLKANGDSVDNTGSVIFIIKDRGEELSPQWIRGYVRSVDDATEDYKDADGKVEKRYKDYSYTIDNDAPSYITTFIDYDEFVDTFESVSGHFFDDPNVYVFLFCTNSLMGSLGTQLVADEAAVQALESSTKVVTEKHPTYFVEEDANKLPRNPSTLTQSYAFGCVRHKETDCDLYFYCVNIYNIDTWSEIIIAEKNAIMPDASAEYMDKYYFDPWYSKLYHVKKTGEEYEWIYMESTEEKKIAQNVNKTLYFCRRRDMLYKGLYEKYVYTIHAGETLPQGNYCVETPYYFGWFFTTDKEMNIISPASENYVLGGPHSNVNFSKEDDKYVSAHIPITADKWYEYHFENKTRVYGYDDEDQLVSDNEYMGGKEFGVNPDAEYLIVEMPEAPIDGEYIKAKTSLDIWVDTANNVVYQESNVKDVVEAQSKKYDTVSYPDSNILATTKFSKGTINDSGVDISSTTEQRSYNIDVTPSVTYEFKLPVICKIAIYDVFKHLVQIIRMPSDSSEEEWIGTVEIGTNWKYVKILYPTTQEFDTSKYYLRIQDYQNKVIVEKKVYTILQNIHKEGVLKGIDNLMHKFALQADVVYGEYLDNLLAAQQAVKNKETELSDILKDLYREGWIKDESYIKGDENKLYRDTLSNLYQISRPETTYDVEFLDTYGSNEGDEYYVDENTSKLKDIDIQSNYAVHLIDPEINTNLWCYVDTLNKCYDQPWNTTLEINTNLSDVSEHSFTDVMSYIAEVAKRTKANQSVYARAGSLNQDGSITTEKIKGEIKTAANKISGGNSNWETDERGNIVVESQDGLGAIMITGTGILNSNGKNEDGDWNWNTVTTGEGVLADSITSGTIKGALIEAGSIMADALASNVGQALDIASNEALWLYATVDGVRPAGGLDTVLPGTGDSYIIIEAGRAADPDQGIEERAAHIDIASGGNVDIYSGSTMNIRGESEVNIIGSDVNISAEGSKNSTTTITGSVVNIKGGSKVNITADPDTSAGKINILSGGTLDLQSGGTMNITAGGTLNISSINEQDHAQINIMSGGDITIQAGGKLSLIAENETTIDDQGNEVIVQAEPAVLEIRSGGKLDAQGGTIKITADSVFRLDAGTGFSIYSPNFWVMEVPINRDAKIPKYNNKKFDELTRDQQYEYLDSLQPNEKKTDVHISGDVSAQTGTIGGFTIDTTKIYNGVSSLSDNSNTGIYMGTDGFKFVSTYIDSNNVAVKYTPLLFDNTQNKFDIDLSHANQGTIKIAASYVDVGGVQLDTTLTNMQTSIPKVSMGTSFPTQPAPNNGDIFYNTSTHSQYIYYNNKWTNADQDIPEVKSITGAKMTLNADEGSIYMYTTSPSPDSETQTNNYIAMDENGIALDSNAGLSMKSGGKFYIDSTFFDVDVQDGRTDGLFDSVTIGQWTFYKQWFSSGDVESPGFRFITGDNEGSMTLYYKGTGKIYLEGTGLYIGTSVDVNNAPSSCNIMLDQRGIITVKGDDSNINIDTDGSVVIKGNLTVNGTFSFTRIEISNLDYDDVLTINGDVASVTNIHADTCNFWGNTLAANGGVVTTGIEIRNPYSTTPGEIVYGYDTLIGMLNTIYVRKDGQ